ncbi:MAG TPA: STAS domain-containing protein [Labilithrix sp.]|nr:STAS domain-containing protein [Labilithrix sp.]
MTSTSDQYRTLLRGILDANRNTAIFALDREYRYIEFNQVHRTDMQGAWGKEIAVGESILEFTRSRPEDYTKAKEQFDRALCGEHFVERVAYGDAQHVRRTFETTYWPLHGTDGSTVVGLAAYVTDVTEQIRAEQQLAEYRTRLEKALEDSVKEVERIKSLEADLAERNAELSSRADEHAQLVEQLRLAVDELSTPVLEVWRNVLVMPIVGVIDTERSGQMVERLLAELMRHGSRFVIVDITGVATVDTSTADRLIKMARSVELLGAECIVTGIQPSVAQTLVSLGVDFASLLTQRNLKHALELCIKRLASEAATEALVGAQEH